MYVAQLLVHQLGAGIELMPQLSCCRQETAQTMGMQLLQATALKYEGAVCSTNHQPAVAAQSAWLHD